MLETIELNVEVEVQTLIWKMKNRARKFGSAGRGLHFLVCAQANHLSTEDEYFLTITTLSGGFLVTNWLVREQQMLRDVGFSVFCRFNSKPT